MCVCALCNHRDPVGLFAEFSSFPAQGHSISLGLCPTKLPVKWDIQLGQLDVPAILILGKGLMQLQSRTESRHSVGPTPPCAFGPISF